jgi:hypothetical protein
MIPLAIKITKTTIAICSTLVISFFNAWTLFPPRLLTPPHKPIVNNAEIASATRNFVVDIFITPETRNICALTPQNMSLKKHHQTAPFLEFPRKLR